MDALHMSTPVRIAMATFVKTPGMSPIKTRLAAGIGAADALAFYIESVGHTFSMIDKLKYTFAAAASANSQGSQNVEFQPYWAVAEKQAMGALFWQKWPQVWQGEGGLGERIATIYTKLREQYDVVALYGADTPHIDVSRLKQGLDHLLENKTATVVGPTEDGGFYFLASRLKVSPEVWLRVTYSESDTLAQLQKNWPEKMHELQKDFDVDTVEDLKRLQNLPSFL